MIDGLPHRAERTRWLQLPVFVYGTLRRAQANFWLLRGATVCELPATLTGGTLYALRNFPVLIEDHTASEVVGEAMVLHPAHYGRILPDLDVLEGYDPTAPPDKPTLYRRERRLVRVQGKPAPPSRNGMADTAQRGDSLMWAWVYIGSAAVLAGLPYNPDPIPYGDWSRWQRERLRRIMSD
jgi:gamma-glutamylcyclotransferase (GGCT)/AIG2-like uncharacterized protein YtfP